MTDAEILAALRNALFALATTGNKSYTIAGRTFIKSDLTEIEDLIGRYENRIAAASSSSLGGGGVLATFNDDCRRGGWPL